MLITSVDSEIPGWKYVALLPSSTIVQKANYVRIISLLNYIACLIIGSFFAFIFIRRNYNPVKELMKIIMKDKNKKKDDICDEAISNEYNFILKSFQETIKDKSEMENQLNRQNAVIKTNVIERLLLGRLDEVISMQENCRAIGIDLISDKYICILVYIDDYSDFAKLSNKINDETEMKLVKFIINNILEDLLGQKHRLFTVEINNLTVILVNLNSNSPESETDFIYQSVMRAVRIINEKFHIYFSAAISQIHQTLYGINQAYNEVLEAIELKLVENDQNVFLYRQNNTVRSGNVFLNYDLSHEQKLINLIQVGDYSGAEEVVKSIIDDSMIKMPISFEAARWLISDIFSTLFKTAARLGMTEDTRFAADFSEISKKILGSVKLPDLKAQLLLWLKKICSYAAGEHLDSFKLRNNVIKLIEQNYANTSLGVSFVADNLNYNSKYLSSVFKQQTGMSIVYYINRSRLEKAKSLLQSRSMSISEVASRTGFINSSTLIRAFKKFEGITPGQYKNL